ncbi:hypothetical protein [Aeromonas sp. QDB08]|uniref:hypothetical protein n=1 Tax=Aeromonas TaxID=642 RepID=UPI0022E0A9F0|nr:hypothetical protein [Aeromonas sp. QDB08]
MISNLMEGIVVWQIAPDEEQVIFNGEKGIPYILPDGSNWLAIMKDDLVIDSISIDIIKQPILDAISQNRDHAFDFWNDGSTRLIANPSIVKRAMRNRDTLLKAGWSYEFALSLLWSIVNDVANDESSSNFFDFLIIYIGGKNLTSGKEHYIISKAVEAYELYMNELDSKKRLKPSVTNTSGVCNTLSQMYLAIMISLLNPCVDRQWENKYNRQGTRGQHRPSNKLAVTLEFMQEKMNKLLQEIHLMKTDEECHDPDEYKPIFDEISTIWPILDILMEEFESNTMEESVQIDAINAAKFLLTSAGIPCRTNTLEQEWVQFVATAWGVTPSQVVSAAKALKKRESQEQK